MGYAGTMDWETASHEALVARVQQQDALLTELRATMAAQQATIARLEQRIGELERGSGSPSGMPGHKPGPASPVVPRPRRKRPLNFARPRATPTSQVRHAVAVCPDCGTTLAGGAVKRTREVIEVVPTPVSITEHVYLERCCPTCRTRHTPSVDLAGVVVGQSRLGVGLLSLIATLREEARLPFAAIQRYLASVHGLTLSVGALVGAVQQVARAAQGALAEISASVRGSSVVHADETGWREGGSNGYIWTFSTPDACFFTHGGRGKGMVDEGLSANAQGVLVSDFYAAYDHYPCLQQKCWAHLLRDVHDLRVRHPTDAELVTWATKVQALYARALADAQALAGTPAETPARQRLRQTLMAELLALCQPALAEETAAQAGLCRRIDKHLASLFVFVLDPAVPATNNAAERSLRHLVIARKISGGTRSKEGTATKLALASLFTTWRLRGRDPYAACLALLASPQA